MRSSIWPAQALGGSAIFAGALALSRSHLWGWLSPATLGCLAYTVAAGYAFYRYECGISEPMLDLRLFRNRTFSFSVLAAILYFCASYALFFTLPLVAQNELGRTGLQAGLLLMPVFALNVILAPVAGRISDRVPARYISTVGALVFAGGLAVLGFFRIIRRTDCCC